MRKFGLIGFPLTHSFSPAYFTAKFKREKITGCSYEAFPIEAIDKLSGLLQNNPHLEGLNVTIPYKKQVIPYLYHSSDAVQQTGACNCIKIKDEKLYGYNTDVAGFEKSFTPLLTPKHVKALILGTGGAAAAVAFVLQNLHMDFLFVSRHSKPAANTITYSDLTQELLEEYLIVINTTPSGTFPNIDACPEIPYSCLTSSHYLYDLVYNPAETLFLKKGVEQGALTKNGADMLAIQAEESWDIWNKEL